LQRSSAVYGKPGDIYTLVFITKDVLVRDRQKNSVISLKDNKKD
jgi:hypothetical protein